jgi:hypothetical protein
MVEKVLSFPLKLECIRYNEQYKYIFLQWNVMIVITSVMISPLILSFFRLILNLFTTVMFSSLTSSFFRPTLKLFKVKIRNFILNSVGLTLWHR